MAAAVLVPLAISAALSAAQLGLSYLLRPKQKPIDRGKLDDVRITAPEYGAFIPRIWGRMRLGGNLIFSSGIQHFVVQTPSGGGKGVPQAPATRTHIYKSSLGVLVCRGEIQNWLRMWQDADLVLGNGEINSGTFDAEDGTLSGGASVDTDAGAYGGEFVTGLGNGGQVIIDTSSVPDPPAPPPDPEQIAVAKTYVTFFYKCSTNLQATITAGTWTNEVVDFPATGADWTGKTVLITGHVDSITFNNASAAAPDLDAVFIEKFWDYESFPFLTQYSITGVVHPNIIYPTDLDDPSAYYNYDPELLKNGGTGTYNLTTSVPGEAIRFYTGTETQTQDAAITAYLDTRYGTGQGVLRASAHRGLAYVIFDNFTLKNGRVPNFTFEVQNGDTDVNDVLTDLFTDVGLSGSDYDITATTSLSQLGFVETSAQSRKALIEQLGRYHFFRLAEIDGKIKTVADTFTSAVTFDADVLRAHDYGEEMPAYDAEIVLKEEHLLPREVRVNILNPDQDYHNETAIAQVFASMPARESIEYSFPIVDELSTARTVAEKILLKAHSEDKAFEFWGMPETARYAVGDVITVPIDGTNYKMRIEKKNVSLPLGKVRFQCVAVNPFTPTYYQDDTTTLASRALDQFVTFQFPRNAIVVAIQSLPIRDAEEGRLGVYIAVSGRGRGAGDTFALYREFDTDNFVIQRTIDTPAQVGLCAGTLATHGTPATKDTTNTLDIWFFDDIELESVTEADIDNHPTLNLMRVGDEWLQFETATVQTLEDNSPYRSKWRISNLWRGRFGTTAAISTHAADEYATHVTNALQFMPLDRSDIGQTITLKAVSPGQPEEVAPTTSFVFSPTVVYGEVGALFDFVTDATTTGTASETLYDGEIAANALINNGEAIKIEAAGTFAANTNTKIIWCEVGGSQIGDVATGVTSNGKDWVLDGFLIREDADTLKYYIEQTVDGETVKTDAGKINSLDFTAAIDFTLRGRTPTNAGDLTAYFWKAYKLPAAPDAVAAPDNALTLNGDYLQLNGDYIVFNP